MIWSVFISAAINNFLFNISFKYIHWLILFWCRPKSVFLGHLLVFMFLLWATQCNIIEKSHHSAQFWCSHFILCRFDICIMQICLCMLCHFKKRSVFVGYLNHTCCLMTSAHSFRNCFYYKYRKNSTGKTSFCTLFVDFLISCMKIRV